MPRGKPRTTPDEERACRNCGKTFVVRAWQPKAFCNRQCWRESRKGLSRPDLEVKPDAKTCPICGIGFLAGGAGRPKRRQLYCSLECARIANTSNGVKCNILAQPEAGYIAGFLDGEAHLTLVKRNGGSIAPRLFISNTHEGVITWLRATIGAGAVHSDNPNPGRHARRWVISINAAATETLLRQLRPYMIVKAEQADLILEFQEKKSDPAFRADKDAQTEYYLAMRTLNKTGPKVPA